jgi:DNA polymerase-3 subunit delta
MDSEQLPRALAKGVGPLWVVHGDEPLLALEAGDRIRAAAKAAGCDEREVLIAEAHFDWSRLRQAAASTSLFATRRLIDLRVPSGKPGVEGGKALAAYVRDLPPDTVTLIVLGEVDWRAQKSAWFGALESAGQVVEARKVGADALPGWLERRLKAQGQSADAATLGFVAQAVEGNLMAAHQEVQKLGLLFPEGPLAFDEVRGAVLDVARFDVFDLGHALLAGDAAKALRVLRVLRAAGEGLPFIVWKVADEARGLLLVQAAVQRGVALPQALRDAQVWGDRAKAIGPALKRADADTLTDALRESARIDRIAKGVERGDAWEALERLVVRLASPAPAAAARRRATA